MKLFLFVCCNTPNPNQQGHKSQVQFHEEKNHSIKLKWMIGYNVQISLNEIFGFVSIFTI